MQVQRHRLLGHRGPQPLDLDVRRRQRGVLGRLAGPARHEVANASNASNAPCLATWHAVTTTERSTPYRSAASRWVACPVTIDIHISYFSAGDNRPARLPARHR